MTIQILMPALSPTMEEGKLAKWLVKEGDTVTSGTIVAEIETDKATMEVEAVDEGTVGKLLVAEGSEGVRVNTPIAVLLEPGEDASAMSAAGGAPAAAGPASSPASSQVEADKAKADKAKAGASNGSGGGSPELTPQAAPASQSGVAQPHGKAAAFHEATPGAGKSAGQRIFASPLARRLAKDQGLDLSLLDGSGPHGRIVKRDVDKAAQTGTGKAGASPSAGTALATMPPGPAAATGRMIPGMSDDKIFALYEDGTYEVVPHDGMRRVIAERLTQSKQTIPHFYLTIECRIDELLRARARLNEGAPTEGPRAYKLSVNDFVIKALALALQDVPDANATWTTQGTLRHRHSDIGVAVAIPGGLFTPVIRSAELKPLSEISNEMKDLAARARKRRLAPHEYQGGTTSISNLGMYGIKEFDAVINPPHSTILAVGAGIQTPVVVDGRVEVATVMGCTLSCDHRVVDGALGANLLNAFKRYIEDPIRMVV